LLLGFAALLSLMLLLVLLAAIGLGPGGSGSLGPLPTPPRFEAAVGDGAAVGTTSALAVGTAQVAPAGVSIASGRVAAPSGVGAGSTPAIAPAQAVQVAATPPTSPTAPASPPPAPQAPEPQPVAVVPEPEAAEPPSSATVSPGLAGTATPPGPIAAGVVPPEERSEACEVEYTVTVAFDFEAIFSGAEDAEIVLHRVGNDGSEFELQGQGGVDDLNALLEQFASEGECVTVEVEPLAEVSPAELAEPVLP